MDRGPVSLDFPPSARSAPPQETHIFSGWREIINGADGMRLADCQGKPVVPPDCGDCDILSGCELRFPGTDVFDGIRVVDLCNHILRAAESADDECISVRNLPPFPARGNMAVDGNFERLQNLRCGYGKHYFDVAVRLGIQPEPGAFGRFKPRGCKLPFRCGLVQIGVHEGERAHDAQEQA